MGNLTPDLGIICGMVTEARALGRWADDSRISVGISGARPDRAEAEARQLAKSGCKMLMSWGVAGGLYPGLRSGELVLPSEIIAEDGAHWAMSQNLKATATAAVPPALRGVGQGGAGKLLGADRIVLDATEKAALYRQTGADAVDMESHRVARVAAEAGLRVLAMRAIGDPADRGLPALSANAISEDGRPRIGPVILGLLRRPSDIASLLRLKRDTDVALRTLAEIADRVVPALLEAV